MPDWIALLRPQRANPAANPTKLGNAVHTENAAARIAALTISSRRRSTRSAHAPEGTSNTNPATDQMRNSAEIWPVDRPASRNRRA